MWVLDSRRSIFLPVIQNISRDLSLTLLAVAESFRKHVFMITTLLSAFDVTEAVFIVNVIDMTDKNILSFQQNFPSI